MNLRRAYDAADTHAMPAWDERDCLCRTSEPDADGNRDLIESDDCPLHGPADRFPCRAPVCGRTVVRYGSLCASCYEAYNANR